jgi:hypothetical protein
VETPDPESARVELARLYLAAFGPASVDDFAWWSGLTRAQARIACAGAGATRSGELLDLGESDGDPPSGVRLLPIWDALFVTWKDRSRFLPAELIPYVYDASGNATSVVLIDGRVAGVWAMGPDDDPLEIRVAGFGSFSKRERAAIEDEATIVARLAGAEQARIHEAGEPPNLFASSRNRFMRPI